MKNLLLTLTFLFSASAVHAVVCNQSLGHLSDLPSENGVGASLMTDQVMAFSSLQRGVGTRSSCESGPGAMRASLDPILAVGFDITIADMSVEAGSFNPYQAAASGTDSMRTRVNRLKALSVSAIPSDPALQVGVEECMDAISFGTESIIHSCKMGMFIETVSQGGGTTDLSELYIFIEHDLDINVDLFTGPPATIGVSADSAMESDDGGHLPRSLRSGDGLSSVDSIGRQSLEVGGVTTSAVRKLILGVPILWSVLVELETNDNTLIARGTTITDIAFHYEPSF